MSAQSLHNLAIAIVAFAVIYALRALPFIVMAKNRSSGDAPWLKVLEKYLSPIIIAALVVYSYSTLEWRAANCYIAGAAVVVLQLLTKSGLFAIFAGTALYMWLVA